tara:strand:- start:73 stop:855 length:783 start_codon:yes stop_codon:yes gene_type:complete
MSVEKIDLAEIEQFFIDLGLEDLVRFSQGREIKEDSPNKLIYENAYAPNLSDLYSLYQFVRTKKRTTILEFGVDWSTFIMALAMKENQNEYKDYVCSKLRRNNPFEIHCLDNEKEYIEIAQKRLIDGMDSLVTTHYSEARMCKWNGRIATEFVNFPVINPDFIYLDGPDTFNIKGDVEGINIGHKDFLPMSCDILKLEHFLLPGTIIVVDGRAANARFLRSNFQRNWEYYYDDVYDQHVFEMVEEPLGKINKRQLEFYNS